MSHTATGNARKSTSTPRDRVLRRQAERQEEIAGQVRDGSLVIRQMTPAEMARYGCAPA